MLNGRGDPSDSVIAQLTEAILGVAPFAGFEGSLRLTRPDLHSSCGLSLMFPHSIRPLNWCSDCRRRLPVFARRSASGRAFWSRGRIEIVIGSTWLCMSDLPFAPLVWRFLVDEGIWVADVAKPLRGPGRFGRGRQSRHVSRVDWRTGRRRGYS
jgi:hypothetical protein